MFAPALKDAIRRAVPLQHKQLLIRYALSSGLEVAIAKLASKGFRPGGVIDVGAYHGEWTRTVSRVLKDVPVLMIEAQSGKQQRLERAARQIGPHVRLEIALLSAYPDQQVSFFAMETGSSIYSENTTVPRERVTLTTKTLDAVVGRNSNMRPPYLLKLDVRGAELDVLRGGKATLDLAEFVILEVSILDYHSGAPVFDEVIAFMKEAGFAIYDILNLNRLPTGELCHLDIMFVHNASIFRPAGMFT